MPIYEYRCGACGHELEVLQKLSEPPLSDCPECKAPALAKLISPVGFQLKGSGWYATDFKGSGKPAQKANGENGDTAKPADTSESKSDSGSGSTSAKTETVSAPSGGCGGNCSCH
jgi:putative FmdB family regulatory protein